MSNVTQILNAIEQGDPKAAAELLPHVYAELRKLAAARLAVEKPGQTLQATGMVHEAYIRLVDSENSQKWNSRGHFFAICAHLMRRILVDYAKARHRAKRGGHAVQVELEGLAIPARQLENVDVLALDDALYRLAELDPQQAKVVELKFFSGFSIEEAAEVLGVSISTVKRDWRSAKAWLRHELEKGGSP